MPPLPMTSRISYSRIRVPTRGSFESLTMCLKWNASLYIVSEASDTEFVTQPSRLHFVPQASGLHSSFYIFSVARAQSVNSKDSSLKLPSTSHGRVTRLFCKPDPWEGERDRVRVG